MVHEYILSTPLNTLPQEIRPSTHMNERYPSLRVMVGQTASGKLASTRLADQLIALPGQTGTASSLTTFCEVAKRQS